jgi:hypothetical protein
LKSPVITAAILGCGLTRFQCSVIADLEKHIAFVAFDRQRIGGIAMNTGAHSIIYSKDPDADRAFLRDVIKLTHVDAGGGWLVFGLPPAVLSS